MKNIFFAADHAGLALKNYLVAVSKHNLNNRLYKISDYGCFMQKSCDFPDFAQSIVQKLKNDEKNIGILVCKTGIGMSIHANRFSHLRAALCLSEESAVLTRQHNNANVLCLGALYHQNMDVYFQILKKFLETEFLGGKYQKRIDLINKYSQKND